MKLGHVATWILAIALSGVAAPQSVQPRPCDREVDNPSAPKPEAPPERWIGLIGEYGPDNRIIYILERDRSRWAGFGREDAFRLREVSSDTFQFAPDSTYANQQLRFKRAERGRAISVEISNANYDRRQVGPADGSGQLHVE